MQNATLLEVRNLCLSVNENFALQNISFNVNKNSLLAIVGESGSGKSLLAQYILNLSPFNARNKTQAFESNVVFFEGRDLAHLDSVSWCEFLGAQIAYIPQEPLSALNPLQKVGKQILEAYLLHHKKSPKHEQIQALQRVLHSVGLEYKLANRYPHELSGGQRQRVALARVLALGANILVLDEPTSALDKSAQKRILSLLLDLQRNLGLCLIFITHDVEILRYFSHTLLVLQNGNAIQYGKTKDFFNQTGNKDFWEVLYSS